jgi:hypothetical protein
MENSGSLQDSGTHEIVRSLEKIKEGIMVSKKTMVVGIASVVGWTAKKLQ